MANKRRRSKGREIAFVQIWLCVFLPAYLLLAGSKGLSSVSPFKTALLYGMTGALALCVLCEILRELRRRRRAGKKPGFSAPPRPASAAALVFLAFTLISALLSPYGSKVWYDPVLHEGAATVCCYILIFLAMSRWAKPTKMVLLCFSAALAVFCLICLLQLAGGNPLGLYPEGHVFRDELVHRSFIGTMGNVDLVSSLLCLAVPMLAIYAAKRRGADRYPAAALAVLCFALMLLIRVLCGPVGLLAGGWVCLLLLPDWKPQTRRLLLLGTAALAFLAAAALWVWDPSVTFLHELHELLHGRISDKFGTGRFFIWRQMLERLPRQLWFGTGPDSVRLTGLEPFRRYDEVGNYTAVAAITDAHCLPLQILYCQGVFALLSWLALMGIELRQWIRRSKELAAAVLGGGIVCFLIAMLFCFSSVILMPFFWAALGLLEAACRNKKTSP